MILPILSYGHKILREPCEKITSLNPDLEKLVNDLWETLRAAKGCGLAAPQIGKSLCLFVVDSKFTYEHLKPSDRELLYGSLDKGIVETFINAEITYYSNEKWSDEEGCLSIPNLSQEVSRSWYIEVEYYDLEFRKQQKSFEGNTARIIQHEFDHTQGVLYLDYLKTLQKKLLEKKLRRIAAGELPAKYLMKYIK